MRMYSVKTDLRLLFGFHAYRALYSKQKEGAKHHKISCRFKTLKNNS